MRGIGLGFPPEIDKADLVKRLRNGGELHPHERKMIADLLEGKKQNHRPRSFAKAIQRDEIARHVFFNEARGWKLPRKVVARRFGLSDRAVRLAIEGLDPEREKVLRAWAASAAPWSEQYLAGETLIDEALIDLLTEVTKRK